MCKYANVQNAIMQNVIIQKAIIQNVIMPHLKGGGDLTTGEGGGQEARRGREDGEGAEGGQKSSLDGKPEGSRLGAAGSLPHAAVRRRS